MMEKELKAEIEAKEDEIKALMDKTCVTELIGTEHKATYKEVVSNRFDSTAFKKDHADMYEAYKKESSSMRFTFA
jgi:predicted phage-related endonuclease